jgi:hypothetical protein
MASALTQAQKRMLEEIVSSGQRVYGGGGSRRTIEALARKGFVQYHHEAPPSMVGHWSGRFTVWATDSGRAKVEKP